MDPNREHDHSSAPPAPQPVLEPTPASAAGSSPTARDAATPEPDPADTLSPAVRRLVRQYDLDVTGIHGTGPEGRIRVGDVIGMLGGRTDVGARTDAGGHGDSGTHADAGGPAELDSPAPRAERGAAPSADTATGAAHGVPQTTVFECDLSRVLSHRKHERRNDVEFSLTSYFLAACVPALRVVPEVAASQSADPRRLGVILAAADGSLRRTLVAVDVQASDDALRLLDGQLNAAHDDDLAAAHLLVHHYGPSGSLLATPTELGAGHAASLGIGRVRREIVVKTVGAEEAPRVAARCYVTLTFRPERVDLARANLFVATLVRVLEQWPSEPTSA